jgi:hypothetical protein
VSIVYGDQRVLYDFVPAQQPPCSDCAGHSVCRS